jgi:site-specific recombinase XerD
MLKEFKFYLEQEGKRVNTVKSYIQHTQGFLKWYNESFGMEFSKLYRQNVLEFKSYLQNIKKQDAKTINAKLIALSKFNEFLLDKMQNDIVISKRDYIKVQNEFASPATVCKKEVEAFRQQILENESKRDYAIVTIMAYAGLRISEVLNLKIQDIDLVGAEITVKQGKGNKQRVVYANDTIIYAVKEHLKELNIHSEYAFVSNRNKPLDRTVVNRLFNKHSEKITPHVLRHFWCSNALEKGYSVHEVANQAGHSNIHTTLLYMNPTREEMKRKANLLLFIGNVI